MKKQSYKNLYSLKLWYKLRHSQLNKEPLCKFCLQKGITKEAKIVDHIVPHRGNIYIFKDADNLQSLCKSCHDSTKKFIENNGFHLSVDEFGMPLDPDHPSRKWKP